MITEGTGGTTPLNINRILRIGDWNPCALLNMVNGISTVQSTETGATQLATRGNGNMTMGFR
jgi:hypothetical protein